MRDSKSGPFERGRAARETFVSVTGRGVRGKSVIDIQFCCSPLVGPGSESESFRGGIFLCWLRSLDSDTNKNVRVRELGTAVLFMYGGDGC